jgi:hypothetical protein
MSAIPIGIRDDHFAPFAPFSGFSSFSYPSFKKDAQSVLDSARTRHRIVGIAFSKSRVARFFANDVQIISIARHYSLS